MLDTIFYFVLNMSITSSFVIIALLLIRQIKPLPRRVIYPLWWLAFFRLIMPFTLSTRWSLFNFTGGLVKRLITIETITQGYVIEEVVPEITQGTVIEEIIPDNAFPIFSAANSVGAASGKSHIPIESYIPIEYKTESLRQVFTTVSRIWVVIAAVMLVIVFVFYILTQRELKKAIHTKENIYRSDMLVSPVLLGLFHPKIILPSTLDPDSSESLMIITHENTHKRRHDNLWRILNIFITCLHWFNPLVWVMTKAFYTDMEQSCDEAVIRKYDTEERMAYAGALLRFAENKRMLMSTAFGRSGVKERIINVLSYKKFSFIGIVASSLFLLVIAVMLITNPQLRR